MGGNIYLIGNNTEINDNTINKLNINDDDLIVLFNKQIVLNFNKIKNHKNKVIFLRRKEKKNFYHGLDEYLKNKENYKEVFYILNWFVSTDFENNKKIYEYIDENNIFKNKLPQSGFIAYNYFKTLLKNTNNTTSKIYLIGFTNIYKHGLWEGHDKDIEQNFYKNELINKIFI